MVFLGKSFAKFEPEKYDFNPYKRFFMEKIHQNSKNKMKITKYL